MWPFKWKLSACTFTWFYLFVQILENEICKFGRNLPLATFGSARVNWTSSSNSSQRGKSGFTKFQGRKRLEKSFKAATNAKTMEAQSLILLFHLTLTFTYHPVISLFDNNVQTTNTVEGLKMKKTKKAKDINIKTTEGQENHGVKYYNFQ